MGEYTGYIYSITNEINGKTYIGKTNDLVRRWKEHCYGKGNTAILNNAFKKYGVEHFIFDIVAQIPFDDVDEMNTVLSQLEMYYIALYKTFGKGYNATGGGDGICFYKHSNKTKEKLSQLQKEKWKDPELRQIMATAALGYHHTEDAKNRISQALLHRDHAIYEKMAEKLRGKVRDHEMIMKAAEKRRKPVLQYDLEGNFIAEYPGIRFIDGFEGKNISACCHGKLRSTQGYIWRFKKAEDFPRKIEVSSKWEACKKPIVQYDLEGNFVAEYESITSAAQALGINTSNLCQCLKGISPTCRRFIWKYKDEHLNHIEVPNFYSSLEREVIQYNKQGEYLGSYESITKAALLTGIGRTSINNCLHRRSKTAGSYIWKYKEETEVIDEAQ